MTGLSVDQAEKHKMTELSRKDQNIVSRQEYYNNIIEDAAHTASFDKWAQHPTPLTRALAWSARRLEAYQETNDQLGINDTEWVIKKLKKEIKKVGLR